MNKRHYIIPIFVPHKGCPHDCIFCNQKKITGHEEEATADELRQTIEDYLGTIPAANSSIEVAFYGGSFTAIPIETQTELLDIAYEFMKSGKIHGIRLSTRPDYIDERISDNLRRFGVSTVELGVQSMDEEVLRLSHRGHTAQDVRNAVALLQSYGFRVGVQVMTGLPGDSRAKCVETVKELIGLKPDIARIYPALVIKNTYMEQLYLRGEYKPWDIEQAAEICKELLILFERNGVEVIRIGLQPTDNIEMGRDVVAGPFHPAMRQLVESLIYRDMAEYLLKAADKSETVVFTVNPKDISNFLGQKRCNIKYLQESLNIRRLTVVQDDRLPSGTVMVNTGIFERSLSKKDYYGII